MLGFGGHFATKSRRYSTTHKTLRADRRTWLRTHPLDWHTATATRDSRRTDETP